MQLISLHAFELLAVTGPEAKKFLQGQVSCNVDLLSPTQSLQGALCNLKGRVISDFLLVEIDGICYLRLSAGMGQVVKTVLGKYIVFSRAECRLVTEPVTRYGVLGPSADAALQAWLGACPLADWETTQAAGWTVIRIPGLTPRFELWQLPDAGPASANLQDLTITTAEHNSEDPWRIEDARAGIVHITPAMSEQYLPATLNYDRSGVINFKKGCYTGQEIVARMYYRGTTKKRLHYGTCQTSRIPETLNCSLAGESEPCELVTAVKGSSDTWHLLGILPMGVNSAGTELIVNNNPEAHVVLHSLPYAVD